MEVLEELIKIGVPVLGTLLGGILGYITASSTNTTQLKKQSLEYNLQLLKEAANHIHSFDSLFQRYLYKSMDFDDSYSEIDYEANPNPELLREMEIEAKKLDEVSSELFQRNDDLLMAQSKLSLVGAKETIQELGRYEFIIENYSRGEEQDSIKTQEKRRERISHINTALHNDRKKL